MTAFRQSYLEKKNSWRPDVSGAVTLDIWRKIAKDPTDP